MSDLGKPINSAYTVLILQDPDVTKNKLDQLIVTDRNKVIRILRALGSRNQVCRQKTVGNDYGSVRMGGTYSTWIRSVNVCDLTASVTLHT